LASSASRPAARRCRAPYKASVLFLFLGVSRAANWTSGDYFFLCLVNASVLHHLSLVKDSARLGGGGVI
jgi:hypothetical protein